MWSDYSSYHLFTQAPAATGAFYCLNSLINPINQPSKPSTMTDNDNESYDFCVSAFSTRYVHTSGTHPYHIRGLVIVQTRTQRHQTTIQSSQWM